MRLAAGEEEFAAFLDDATVYWRNNVLPPGEAVVVTEILYQDLRVALRALTVANAVRRCVPARLVVLAGTHDEWMQTVWSEYDLDRVRRLATAFGADEVIDVHELVDRRLSAADVGSVEHPVLGSGGPVRLPDEVVAATADATWCRLQRVPRVLDAHRAQPEYRRAHRRAGEFASVYAELLGSREVAALVTSHVDYDQWGLAVETARRAEVPVLHVQSTGSLKCYAGWPEAQRSAPTFRAGLTEQIGTWFEQQVWPSRAAIRRSAELVAHRSKGNRGRPSWWRGGATASLDLLSAAERRDLRRHALRRFGFDPDRPVVTVFNHAVSDALGTNVEHFADLAEWFEATVEHASQRDDASWLFLDHPSQPLYDSSEFFAGVAARYGDRPWLAFRPSPEVGKNVLWSLTDLAVTVRGSVSNEMPAYGIPALQAGWSEWSSCGLSRVARDQQDYWAALDDSITRLRAGESLITAEQVERARLWLWFYRCATDVVSPLVPHWELGEGDDLLRAVRVHVRHVESDGDPVFAAVERMWSRRDPFLLRFDLEDADVLRHVLPGAVA